MQKWITILFTCLAFISFQPVSAQKEGAVWYFGQNAGLDFNLGFPMALTEGQINTREGVATICDKEGKLLFYTDGQDVFNRNHAIMENGTGLLGDKSSTQSSVVVPKPGSSTQFFIFTVDQAGTPINRGNGLNYSIVDMALGNLDGAVIQKNTPLHNDPNILFTEKIAVVKHNDTKTYWIIAHEFGTNEFFRFRLTDTAPFISFAGSVGAGRVHGYNPNDRDNRGATGYLKSSPKGEFLATAVEGLQLFELFKFNNKTGDIDLIATLPALNSLDAGDPNRAAAYGIEFSPTSNYLYGSTRKGGMLYQWNLDKLDPVSIQKSCKILRKNSAVLCGALQLAYNGKIYLALGGQPYLGVIRSPIQDSCNYVEQGATLIDNTQDPPTGGRSYFGLPTFLSDFFTAAEFYYENTCQNDITRLYLSANKATIEGAPIWNIFDSTGTIQLGKAEVDKVTYEGTYRFSKPGKYIIELRVIQYGSLITQKREITIHTLPELNLPDTTSLCEGSEAKLDAGEGAFYRWSDNPNLNVERFRNFFEAGRISVTVTHYNGCSNTDATLIVKKPLPVMEGQLVTRAACGEANGSITITMKPDDTYVYAWDYDSTNAFNYAYNLLRGVYNVDITSETTGCTLTKQFTVSEENAPTVTISASVSDTLCPGSPVTLRARGALKYLWETPDGIETDSVVVSPLRTTAYRVMGYSENQAGQKCYGYGDITVPVFQAKYPELGVKHEKCQGDTITLNGGGDYLAWNWSNGESTRVVNLSESDPELILYATDKNQCVLSDTVNIVFKPRPQIQLGDPVDQCQGSPVLLSGNTSGDSFLWSPGGETTEMIGVNEPGTNIYKLRVETNGCSSTDSIQVTIRPLPEAVLNLPRDTTICATDSVRLFEVNDQWNVTYEWSTGKTDPYIFVSQPDVYWIKTHLDGCENSDTVNLEIKPIPGISLKDSTFCKSSPIWLSGDDGQAGSYLWGPNGETSPRIQVSESGIYHLTITLNGCVNSDTANIKANDPRLLVIDSVTSTPVTCPGSRDGTLRIISHGSGTLEYSIDGGSTFSTSPWFQGLYGDNQFKIVVREDNACMAEYEKEITFTEPDSIRLNYRLLSPSCETCPDGEINLLIKGGTPPYSVKWSTNDTVTFLTNMVLGKYLVWVTDAAKCRENALIDLTLGYPPFQIPNAFTPNGDGYNEKWEIAALKDYPECLMKIFNRSGQLIWWSEPGYPEPWDGKDNSGNVLPVGSYYYLVLLQSDLKPQTGSVSILR